MAERPVVEFFQLIPGGVAPKRADRSGAGTLPARAMRYCDAITSATGRGYWIFPPMSFQLMWDGSDTYWSYADSDEWMPISGTPSQAVQFPDFSDHFDSVAPPFLKGYSPPFLTALAEFGNVQIWSGLLVKTRPGWSLGVRSPVNLDLMPNMVPWEGLVETDIWFGPLFTNFRILKTDTPVLLRAGVPFLQVQPIQQSSYSERALADWRCGGPDAMSDDDWNAYGKLVMPSEDAEERRGKYAVTVRKRRLACPMGGSATVSAEESV